MAERNKIVYRGMPNNVEAEQAVLGSILIDQKAADMLVPVLRESDFYFPANKIVFSVMDFLQKESKPIDTVSVADELELRGKLDEVGSIDYLNLLTSSVPSAASGDHYADIVKRDSLIRRVIEAGNNIAKFGYESTDAMDALLQAENEIYSISEDVTEKNLVKAETALGVAMKSIQDAQSGIVSTNTIFSDFPGLDKMTRGFKAGELILLAARPSVGKTAFALNIAATACLKYHKTVAVFSLEMPASLLVKRMLAHVSQVSLSKMDMRGGLSSSVDTGRLFDAYRKLSDAHLYIDDYSMNSPMDVLSKSRRLKRESGLDLIIIDYLQLMSMGDSNSYSDNRQLEVSSMSRRLKIYAKELDVPIIVLSQMSRGVEQRPDHTPKLSDLRESGAIEQDADVVMFLHRAGQFDPAVAENIIQLIVKKNRNGPIGELNLEWTGETTSFRECVGTPAPTPTAKSAPEKGAANAHSEKDEEYVYDEKKQEEKKEDFNDDFVDEEVETDRGLMPFGSDENVPPFDLEEPAPTDDDAPVPTDDDAPAEEDEADDAMADDFIDDDVEDEYVDDLDEEEEDLPF